MLARRVNFPYMKLAESELAPSRNWESWALAGVGAGCVLEPSIADPQERIDEPHISKPYVGRRCTQLQSISGVRTLTCSLHVSVDGWRYFYPSTTQMETFVRMLALHGIYPQWMPLVNMNAPTVEEVHRCSSQRSSAYGARRETVSPSKKSTINIYVFL